MLQLYHDQSVKSTVGILNNFFKKSAYHGWAAKVFISRMSKMPMVGQQHFLFLECLKCLFYHSENITLSKKN